VACCWIDEAEIESHLGRLFSSHRCFARNFGAPTTLK